MVRNWAVIALGSLILVMSPAAVRAQVWEFAADGDAEGWQALHGVRHLQVCDGTLQLVLDPTDPYLWTGETP